MSVFEKVKNRLTAEYSEWIKVEDDKCKWTIEDFPYVSGVDEQKIKPHCWKCVTVNRCWFANEEGKKPESFQHDEQSRFDKITRESGLYHPNCHCEEIGININNELIKEAIVEEGKIGDLFDRKGNLVRSRGYREEDSKELQTVITDLALRAYKEKKYKIYEHDKYGVKISLYISIPGKNEKHGRFYNRITGFTIFPNGKLKNNTMVSGRWR